MYKLQSAQNITDKDVSRSKNWPHFSKLPKHESQDIYCTNRWVNILYLVQGGVVNFYHSYTFTGFCIFPVC